MGKNLEKRTKEIQWIKLIDKTKYYGKYVPLNL